MEQMLIDACTISHPAGEHVAEHRHKIGQLILIIRGTMTVTTEEGWWLVPPGLAVWVPPAKMHSSTYSEDSTLISVQFMPDLTGQMPGNCRPVMASELLRELALETVRLSKDKYSYAAQKNAEPALKLIGQLMVLQINQPENRLALFVPHGKDKRLRQATTLMQNDPGNEMTLQNVATSVNTSGRTLARLFIAETGMTFRRWREHMRLVIAVDRLARGESITRTAHELGYSSSSSFTTLFTRVLGMPPRKYMLEMHASPHLCVSDNKFST